MKELTELPDVDHLIELAAADPITAALECRQALGTLNLACRERLYVLLGAIYAVAYAIERDNRKWNAFIKLPLWEGMGKRQPRREKDRDKRLRLVFVYVSVATTDALYERAYTYSRALQKFYNRGVKPERIPSLIEVGGGIEKIYREAVKEARDEKRRASNRDYLKDFNDEAGQETDQSGRSWQAPKPRPRKRQQRTLDVDVVKDALNNALRQMRQPQTKLQRQIVGAVAQLEAGLLDWAKRR